MKFSGSRNSSAILLVDDNKFGLSARKSVLQEQGHRVTTAAEGEQALECFRRERFDLVITDYKMPKMNGVELIKGIRALDASVPIILISGYAEALGLNEANTGADLVIPKNANEVQHLLRAVNRLLRRKSARKPAASHHPVPPSSRRASG